MKTIYKSVLFVLFATATLTSCAQDKAKTDTKEKQETVVKDNDKVPMEKPDSPEMSKEDLSKEVQSKAVEAVDEASTAIIDEAVMAIEQTSAAIKAINDKDKKKAMEAMERVTGKLELLVARNPNAAFIPVEVTTTTSDLIADLEAIKVLKKVAEEAIEDDYLQVAREAIADLESQVEITTVSLPLATYPAAMKAAAILLDANKMDEAKVALYTALNTLVIETEVIPLPILKAEVMIAAAMTEDAKDEDKKKEVLNLLDNAEYQLIMAEELGYGKRDKEYKELNKAIKEIKKSIKDNGESQGLFSKLKNKLNNFKNRTSTKSSNQ
jgi:tetratricopeptide (TPR) repeat protein